MDKDVSCKDMRGIDINVGDTIVYIDKYKLRGSRLVKSPHLAIAKVIEVDDFVFWVVKSGSCGKLCLSRSQDVLKLND